MKMVGQTQFNNYKLPTHFNENGYKFIAEKIVEFINENEVK